MPVSSTNSCGLMSRVGVVRYSRPVAACRSAQAAVCTRGSRKTPGTGVPGRRGARAAKSWASAATSSAVSPENSQKRTPSASGSTSAAVARNSKSSRAPWSTRESTISRAESPASGRMWGMASMESQRPRKLSSTRARAPGSGTSPSSASTMVASVPSEPTTSCARFSSGASSMASKL